MTAWTTPKTWAAGVLTAAELNEQLRDNTLHLYERVVGYAPTLAADIGPSSSETLADATGLDFPVANGTNYSATGIIMYSHSSTSGGPRITFDHPGGTCNMLVIYNGNTSAVSEDKEAQNTTDEGGTGIGAVNTADARYFIRVWVRYDCTASGTFTLRYARAAASSAGSLTIYAGSSLFVTSD